MGLAGTTEDIKWEDNLCFLVADKIFLLCSLIPPHQVNLKVDKAEFRDLVARDGIRQAAHFARGQWVEVASPQILSDAEMRQRIVESRALVISKLTKKRQAEFS